MARKFPPSNRVEVTTIHGASEFELEMSGRLNSMVSRVISGHSGIYRGGGTGSLVNHFSGPMPPLQNFAARSAIQSAGATRGYRTNGFAALPGHQPSGPTPLRNLLLPPDLR